jgi:hypothetical protein
MWIFIAIAMACICCCASIYFASIIGVQGAQNNVALNNPKALITPRILRLCPAKPEPWAVQDFVDDTYCVKPGAIGIADETGKMVNAVVASACPYRISTINGLVLCVNSNNKQSV